MLWAVAASDEQCAAGDVQRAMAAGQRAGQLREQARRALVAHLEADCVRLELLERPGNGVRGAGGDVRRAEQVQRERGGGEGGEVGDGGGRTATAL